MLLPMSVMLLLIPTIVNTRTQYQTYQIRGDNFNRDEAPPTEVFREDFDELEAGFTVTPPPHIGNVHHYKNFFLRRYIF